MVPLIVLPVLVTSCEPTEKRRPYLLAVSVLPSMVVFPPDSKTAIPAPFGLSCTLLFLITVSVTPRWIMMPWTWLSDASMSCGPTQGTRPFW